MVLIDKPAGWTSFDVVAKIRGRIRKTYLDRGEKPTKRQLRVGHSGTLDPFATGLLIILLGDACTRADEFLKLDKVYEATITLGATSTTGDPEGIITETERPRGRKTDETAETVNCRPETAEIADNTVIIPKSKIQNPKSISVLTQSEIQTVLRGFTGSITQTPPAYSAIKVGGKRAYQLAREGKAVTLPSRQVTVHSIELLSYDYPELRIRTHVSSGTYIRSLAQDIGRALGTGAYCSQLRRTRIGRYDLADAVSVESISQTIASSVSPQQ